MIGIVLIGVGLSFTDKEKALRKKNEIASRTTSSYKHGQLDRILDKGLNAEIGYYKGLKPEPQDVPQNTQPTTDVPPTLVSINLDNDTEIKEFIDVFISLTHLQKLKID